MLSETPKPLSGIKDSHHGPSAAMHNPPQPLKVSQKTLVSFLTEITLISTDFLTSKHQSDAKVFTMTMEILPEPTSNKLCGQTGMHALELLLMNFFGHQRPELVIVLIKELMELFVWHEAGRAIGCLLAPFPRCVSYNGVSWCGSSLYQFGYFW
ncbi:hypothetical protein Tco_0271322 [Tanacetum coccineum]